MHPGLPTNRRTPPYLPLALRSAERARRADRPTLLQLARRRFADRGLTPPEVKLFEAVENDRFAFYDKDGPDADRTIPAEAITWLCSDPRAKECIGRNGLRLYGALVIERIDLDNIRLDARLVWRCCKLREELSLIQAEVAALSLSGTRVGGINADRIKVQGSVFLRRSGDDRFHAIGEVRLLGANIGGNLDCIGGRFDNKRSDALSVDGAKIKGNVFMNCSGDQRFHATGEVRLLGAHIGGDLDCGGGRFENKGGHALSADRAEVKSSVFLSRSGDERFHATGAVRLPGAHIGGGLYCTGTRFDGLLNMQAATVRGGWVFRSLWRSSAMPRVDGPGTLLDLSQASFGVVADDDDAPSHFQTIVLSGFKYGGFDGDASTDARFRIERWLRRQPEDLRSRPQPYEQLAGVLRKMGHRREAERVLIEYQRVRRWEKAATMRAARYERQVARWFAWLFSWMYDLLLGYGYRWGRPLWISVVILIASAMFFGVAYERGGIVAPNRLAHVPEERVVDQAGEASYPAFNAVTYALDVFVPLVDLEQTKYWQPVSNAGGWGVTATWVMRFDIAVGWVLTTLFVTGLAQVVRREGGESTG
ncbi:MAG: hypothetical protein AAF823_15750 [Planctomycetota bacterium]